MKSTYNRNDFEQISNAVRDAKEVARQWNKRSSRQLRKGAPRAEFVAGIRNDYKAGHIAIKELIFKFWSMRHDSREVRDALRESIYTIRYLKTLNSLL